MMSRMKSRCRRTSIHGAATWISRQLHEAPIRPLIDDLDFIEDKTRWGYRFRFGVFEISEHDLGVIRAAMGAGAA